jgi:tRNA/tmRNA/rRNA uracil-C5-methylase (TrmA/RlmC/RlmD family)
MTRHPRARRARGRSRVGERFEVEVGPVAHGGHCVARAEGRVVFTRHAVPGERVVVKITEGSDGDRFWRGDAVEVLEASADRVTAPCPVAGPGLCGGCDFQHVALPAQRLLKAEVVREQLVRVGRLDAADPLLAGLAVEEVPNPLAAPGEEGLRWRTRVAFARTPDGRRGMRRHRSRSVVPVEDCLIAAPDARVVVADGPAPVDERVDPAHGTAVLQVVDTAHGSHTYEVDRDGFWQVHPGAPRILVETTLELLEPRTGEHALDLYAGVGLFAAFLAEAVGVSGRVVAVEGNRSAAHHARDNLSGHPQATVEAGAVDRVLATAYDDPFQLVVLDPPREGARRAVVDQVAARRPRAVAYVACDPAALARDIAIFAEHGYGLRQVRAFDLFPMTHHVECVALLAPAPDQPC